MQILKIFRTKLCDQMSNFSTFDRPWWFEHYDLSVVLYTVRSFTFWIRTIDSLRSMRQKIISGEKEVTRFLALPLTFCICYMFAFNVFRMIVIAVNVLDFHFKRFSCRFILILFKEFALFICLNYFFFSSFDAYRFNVFLLVFHRLCVACDLYALKRLFSICHDLRTISLWDTDTQFEQKIACTQLFLKSWYESGFCVCSFFSRKCEIWYFAHCKIKSILLILLIAWIDSRIEFVIIHAMSKAFTFQRLSRKKIMKHKEFKRIRKSNFINERKKK